MIAEVIRSGFEESRHRGSAVLLGAGGREVLYSAGEVTAPMFPRSSNKPIQAAAMRACAPQWHQSPELCRQVNSSTKPCSAGNTVPSGLRAIARNASGAIAPPRLDYPRLATMINNALHANHYRKQLRAT